MNTDLTRGMLVGLLIGAGVGGHTLRLVTLKDARPSLHGRRAVAESAIGLYLLAAGLVLSSDIPTQHGGETIAIVGPFIGVSAVLILKAHGAPVEVDAFQRVLGVFQAIAAMLAGLLLWASL